MGNIKRREFSNHEISIIKKAKFTIHISDMNSKNLSETQICTLLVESCEPCKSGGVEYIRTILIWKSNCEPELATTISL